MKYAYVCVCVFVYVCAGFVCERQENLTTWCFFCFLSSLIKEEKEKEEPKTIPLRVYGKGINTFAVVSLRILHLFVCVFVILPLI